MKNKYFFNILMVGMVACATPALAKEYYRPYVNDTHMGRDMHSRMSTNTSDTFAMLDRNQDNALVREEYNNVINSARYTSVDRNGDGVISRTEFNNYDHRGNMRYGRGGRLNILGNFDEMDRNGNGRITRGEYRTAGSSVPFDTLDRNRDGRINRHELNVYLDGNASWR